MYYKGEMNAWGATAMSFVDLGTDIWKVTIQSDGDDGNSMFKFSNTTYWSSQNWSRGDVITLNSYTTFYIRGGDGIFNESNTKYYTFNMKDVTNDANSEGFVMETSASPVSISSVTQSPLSTLVSNNDAVTVTIVLSAAKSSEENVYVRYSVDGWSTSSLALVGSYSGATGTATILAQSAETVVSYYVFSTTSASPTSNYDLLTLNFDNNSGSNYSYTVQHGSAGNGDWNQAGSWTSSSVPNSADDVIIEHTITVTNAVGSQAECNDLTVNSGSTVNISVEKALTVKGNLINNETFTVKSDASGTGSIIVEGSATGNVTVERFLTKDVWHYISGQTNISGNFDGLTMGLTPGAGNDQFYRWDESLVNGTTGFWVDILNGNESGTLMDDEGFVACRGYAATYVTDDKNLSLSGVPYVVNKTITITNTSASTNPGANLVGNPFTSTIAANSDAQTTNNFIDQNASVLHDNAQAVYMWNEGIDDYTTINNSSGATYIAPGQGFMVIAKNASGSLAFNVAQRKHGTATFYKNTASNNTNFDLTVVDSQNNKNLTTISFKPEMTLGLDPSYDARKLKGNPNIALYTRLVQDSGVDFAIQALPTNDIESITIPVGIDVINETTCEFSIKPDVMENYPVYLQDTKENTVTNLKENSYSTTVNESGTGRFFLHFRDISDINNNEITNHLNIFTANNKIEIRNNKPIDATINIYNIAGQLITTSQLNNESSTSVNIPNYKGIAIVSITTSGQTLNKKVIIW